MPYKLELNYFIKIINTESETMRPSSDRYCIWL